MKSTNYYNTLIEVAPDCKVERGTVPTRPETVVGLQYELLSRQPYGLTSDDLLFEVHCRRQQIEDRAGERERFFSRSQACLRASPLAKQYGWGLHHDAQGKVALIGLESPDYARLCADPAVATVKAMRSKR